jgi:mono/diheme cytochrome c family protein
MPRFVFRFLALLFTCTCIFSAFPKAQHNPASAEQSTLTLRTTRTSPFDLELTGDLRGMPSGESRFLTREDLLALPQNTYTVDDDSNFPGATKVSGVSLDLLLARLSSSPQSDLVVAVCSDHYYGYYSHDYLAAHHPLLVLTINGQSPSGWPKNVESRTAYVGPYLISHPKFVPAFQILSHADLAQIPWGVVRLEFRDEKNTFSAIAPHGPQSDSASVQAGYRIAQQNCFRCHNQGNEGGQKAGRTWEVLSAWAFASPQYFSAYVRDPRSKYPHANMPGFPNYDDATLLALISYFRTFGSQVKP